LLEQRASKIAGKGSKIHKLLGIVSLRIFSSGIDFAINCDINSVIDEILQKEDVGSLLQIKAEEIAEIKQLAFLILSNLISNLSFMMAIIGVNKYSRICPVVEQQFVDYQLHMRGVPDLILEFPEEKAAIVVEWKTSRETPLDYEKAQTICYALMEATRLGYRTKDKAIKAILGELQERNGISVINNVKILPAIIRPTTRGRIHPHPLTASDPLQMKENYLKFKKLVYDVCLLAEHLTLLTADVRTFVYSDENLEKECSRLLRFGDQGVQASIFRIKPKQIFREHLKNVIVFHASQGMVNHSVPTIMIMDLVSSISVEGLERKPNLIEPCGP